MTFVTLIGLLAGICTTISLLPQAIKCWKEKKTRDLSLGMYIIFTIGVLLWLVYGLYRQDLPMILANAVSSVLAAFILFMKIKHG